MHGYGKRKSFPDSGVSGTQSMAIPNESRRRPRARSVHVHDSTSPHAHHDQLSYSHQTTVPSPQPNSLRDTPQLERQQRRAPVPSVIPPGYPDGTTWVVDNGRPRLMIPEPHMPQHETQSPAAHSSKYRHRMHITDTTSRVNTTEGNRDRLLPAFKSSPPVTSQDLHYRSPGPNVGWRDSPREKINFPFDTVPVTPPSGLSRRSRSHSRSRPEQIPPLEQNGLPVPSVSFHPQRYNRPAPMPTVIPPGYPEGTRWIVGSGGRPKLETPKQYIARYGAPFPAHPVSGANHQDPTPQSPIAPSPSPRKPFLKRAFGWLGRSRKATRTTEPAPNSSESPVPPQSSTIGTRPRTKSL